MLGSMVASPGVGEKRSMSRSSGGSWFLDECLGDSFDGEGSV